LETTVDTSTWKKLPSVQGITADKVEVRRNGIGYAQSIRRSSERDGNDRLLWTFSWRLQNFDHVGWSRQCHICAYNRGDDYWTCTNHDLIGNAGAFKGDSVFGETDPNEDSPEDADPNESHTLIHLDQQPHYSAEEQMRAKLRHPGEALDNETFASSHLSAQDFRIGRAIFGVCPACTEGKIRAPKEPTSKSEPGNWRPSAWRLCHSQE
jgi:hypothetical protein